MPEKDIHAIEETAVDDVRRVREKIAAQHHGNLHEHIEESNRIAECLRLKLNVRIVSTSAPEDIAKPAPTSD